MRVLSATDSISPAIQRTRNFLFRPFNWGTFLKLGLVAILTEGLGSNFQSSSHHRESPQNTAMNFAPFHLAPQWIAAIVAMALLVLFVAIVLFYLVTRLRFAFFHCLTRNTTKIRPGWELYRPQATRFFWMNLGVGFCYLLVVALSALPFAAGFWRVFQETQQGGSLDVWLLLSLVLPLIPILLLLFLAGIVIDLILRDCMLPHYALEDATAGEAWGQVWARITAEKRQFLAYALLRIALPAVAMAAIFIVLIIPGLILFGSLAAAEYGLHSAFAGATGAAAIAGILVQVFFGVVAFGLALLASICLGGPLSAGVREYALVFYGGRYQALGDILYPPAPPVASAPQIA